MLERIVTGGQAGVDQAAWRAARAAGLATGGWMPHGFLTEDGPRPEFAAEYGAQARESDEVDERTIANVAQADAVLVIAGAQCGAGTRLTIVAAHALGKPCRVVAPDLLDSESEVAETASWVLQTAARALLVAGDRASAAPDLGPRVETFLIPVFQRVKRDAESDPPS